MKLKEICRSVEERTGERCTPAMINNYERVGLIPPPPRTKGGTRIFSEEYARLISRIVELKSRYLRLEAVKEILEREDALKSGRQDVPDGGFPAKAERKAEGRRAEIVDAAILSFSQKGYHETKISDIAERIGCGVGTIYNYFPGKKNLLLAAVDGIIDIVLEKMDRINEIEDNPIARIRKKGLAFLGNYNQIKDIMFILEGEAVGEDADFSSKAATLIAKYTGAMIEDLDDAIHKGLIRDIDSKAASYELFGMILMMGYLISQDNRYSPETLVDNIADALLNGILIKE
ncbi:MAG: TetR family transcriptional regulator [Actinobacteria bacterium]|nr:TetR family transcriptional regulator [Actinomycetota bacterium]